MSQFIVTTSGSFDTFQAALAGYLPHTVAAKSAMLQAIHNKWVQQADNAFKKPTRGYRSSIKVNDPPDNPLGGSVVATAPYASVIEHGHSGYSLKKMLYTSDKVRWMWTGRGKNRRLIRALIIPFRHALPARNTTGEAASMPSMPPQIAAKARKMTKTTTTGNRTYGAVSRATASTLQARFFGMRNESAALSAEFGEEVNVKRATYNWGDRLTGVGGIYEGMVRMDRGSGYVTFRVMTEDQPDDMWRVPPRPGQYLASKTAQAMKAEVQRELRAAFRRDVGLK